MFHKLPHLEINIPLLTQWPSAYAICAVSNFNPDVVEKCFLSQDFEDNPTFNEAMGSPEKGLTDGKRKRISGTFEKHKMGFLELPGMQMVYR